MKRVRLVRRVTQTRPALHPYLTGTPAPRVIAHRGLVTAADAARGVLENTHAAFTAAVAAGASYLESDCRVTRDGVIVLAHDADLAGLLGEDRTIASLTHRELAARFSDRGGLLTLDELFEAFPHARFNLDVKEAAAAVPMGRAIGTHSSRVLLASFDERWRAVAFRAAMVASLAGRGGTAGRGGAPAAMRRPATSPGRGALIRQLLAVHTRAPQVAAQLMQRFDAVQVPLRQGPLPVLTPRLIAAARQAGTEVHAWTINDPDEMLRLTQLGVCGIITDRADLALKVLSAGDQAVGDHAIHHE